MGDTDTETVRVQWADIVSLEDKELAADLGHDRQLMLSQKYVVAICVR